MIHGACICSITPYFGSKQILSIGESDGNQGPKVCWHDNNERRPLDLNGTSSTSLNLANANRFELENPFLITCSPEAVYAITAFTIAPHIPLNYYFNHAMSQTSMDTFDARHASFINWPHAGRLNPQHMAAAGFYQHTPGSDAVSCFNCDVSMENWNENSDPITEHQSASPNCTWNNGTYMTTVDERLGSFHTWPIEIKPLPIAMASAGFYHSNKMTDSVTCFCCKLALRDWKKNDDPIDMHFQHAPINRHCSWIHRVTNQPEPYVPPPLPVSALAGIPRKCQPCNRTFPSGNKFHQHRRQTHRKIGGKVGIALKRPGAMYLGKHRVSKPVALSRREKLEKRKRRVIFGRVYV